MQKYINHIQSKRPKHAVHEKRNIVLEHGTTQELLGRARAHGHQAASQKMAVVKLGVVDACDGQVE